MARKQPAMAVTALTDEFNTGTEPITGSDVRTYVTTQASAA